MEETNSQIKWWESHFREAPNHSQFDFISRDGSILLEIKSHPQGFRGMHDGLIGIASGLRENPDARWGCLVINASKMTVEKIESKWHKLKVLFADDIVNRLAIIMIRKKQTRVIPNESFLVEIADAISANPKLGFQQLRHSRNLPPTNKKLEITKVLILRWLEDKGPIGVGELGSHVGCSYPTVRNALNELSRERHLNDEVRPSVELNRLSDKLWNDVVTLSSANRTQARFCDRSGQPSDPLGLLKRLNRLAPENVAIGGVVAARHWQPNFDLNGTPRIDLLVHCPEQHLDLDFVTRLDPALEKTNDPEQSAVLVVHTIGRAVTDFVDSTEFNIPIADPVETILDLIDLGLTQQASNLLAHFREVNGIV